jgi:hypothetical protein
LIALGFGPVIACDDGLIKIIIERRKGEGKKKKVH